MWYHLASIQGKRPYNEDEIFIDINLDNKNNNQPINLFSIFDGHGGNDISKYLKKNLYQYFINKNIDCEISKSSKFNKYIIKIFDYVQQSLTNYNIPSKNTGSTALLSIFYSNKNFKIINLGDCRAIMCNDNNIAIPLTKDHKPTSFDEYERIINLNGKIIKEKNDDARINGMAVSRAFGDLDAKPHVSHVPDIFDYTTVGYKFLVMACDGLWDVLDNQEVVDFILSQIKTLNYKENYTSIKAKNNIATKLVNLAYERGSEDNISCIIIFF